MEIPSQRAKQPLTLDTPDREVGNEQDLGDDEGPMPVVAVIGDTPGGTGSGGTGQAYRLARTKGSQVVELGAGKWRNVLDKAGPDIRDALWIVHVPTKRHWRNPSRLDDVAKGIEALEESIRTHGWKSAGVPKLGCRLGGLEWPAVREVLEGARARAARMCVITLYGPTR